MKYVGLNGAIVEEDKAVISILDHGFLYGIGLFETFRTYGGVPFLLKQHLERLSEACEQLGIIVQLDSEFIIAHIRELLNANGLQDGYVRFSVSAGSQPLGLPTEDYEQPNIIVYVKSLPSTGMLEGKALQVLRLRRNTPEGQYRTKSFHYMNNILAKREMSAYAWAKHAEGLFLDQEGNIAEGIVSNLFFVRDGVLYTPSIDIGILPGITRAHVLQLAKQEDIRVVEGKFPLKQLCEAEEIFITNSIQELISIQVIYNEQGEQVWLVRSGSGSGSCSCTERLKTAYRSSIEAEMQRS